MTGMQQIYVLVPLAPLAGAIIAGLFCRVVSRSVSHWATILLVALSFVGSCVIFADVIEGNTFNGTVYTWLTSGGTSFEIGFLIDRLSALMMVVVTFVSLMVHIYTIGYMADDPGYQRFFGYISLFTFSMLMLVMANNFIQLFFGWEAVGLVSYLLIGFWYTRPTAVYANLKAFLVNRVGDFGFLMGIALVLAYFGTLDYTAVFEQAPAMSASTIEIFSGSHWALLTVICIGLFVGAMGKSAQFPLHVWLPDSMEGPTPISALIHAATMVTAGIFMVARMSPLFELSDTARSFVLVIGGITAFFMALVALVQYDIKRVVAYSTLSQLGYMTVALGASAYGAAIFHLMTHAFFKAVLFLGAGSVIIALHHEQDMRRMGGLRKYMPITYATMLIGAFANAGFPPFAGFFSKDTIIEAVQASHTTGAGFAYLATLCGVFIGGLYSFRLIFYAFHGEERFRHSDGHGHGASHGHDEHAHAPHETPAVVTVPLILLAIPSICAGWIIGWIVFGDYFGTSIAVASKHEWIAEMTREFHGVWTMMAHGLSGLPFWFATAGLATAWYLYIARPELPAVVRSKAGVLTTILERKYGFDEFNQWFFANGAVKLGTTLWKIGDVTLIDGVMVNGSAKLVGWVGGVVREIQSGRIYHYAFSMILGVFVLLTLYGMLAAAG
ncbi:MAG: NADH-quinone oxidoreductase subunit L [Betaproteobacteria bacterium RIFCSPLOWO2_02_FULL_63_19]|nr:MAG: NADH-quinone oxidoreductase subunit L [Betaproteobacteria bacterium RIFCSPLOWO2_02_FULL_63_19]